MGILITPADAMICTKVATTIALPESDLFKMDLETKIYIKLILQLTPI
ncbi:MAG TPA: hypothetical protein PL055_07435 [Methanobacterium sp.]|nr:hypothetical protein [Methanobacterium sp.]